MVVVVMVVVLMVVVVMVVVVMLVVKLVLVVSAGRSLGRRGKKGAKLHTISIILSIFPVFNLLAAPQYPDVQIFMVLRRIHSKILLLDFCALVTRGCVYPVGLDWMKEEA